MGLLTVQKDGYENPFSVRHHWIFAGLLRGFEQSIGFAKEPLLPDNQCPVYLCHTVLRQVLLCHLHSEVRDLDVHLWHLHLLSCRGLHLHHNSCCNYSFNLCEWRSSLSINNKYMLHKWSDLSELFWHFLLYLRKLARFAATTGPGPPLALLLIVFKVKNCSNIKLKFSDK